MRSPYDIIIKRHITEKSTTLLNLQSNQSNRSIARFNLPKYVFIVAPDANKHEIAAAVEAMYKDQNVKVKSVNTINVKQKPKRRGRGRPGGTPTFKKAIVTLDAGDVLDQA